MEVLPHSFVVELAEAPLREGAALVKDMEDSSDPATPAATEAPEDFDRGCNSRFNDDDERSIAVSVARNIRSPHGGKS